MLYEVITMMVKGAGSQGVQNGSISCIALPESLPGGVRAVLAEKPSPQEPQRFGPEGKETARQQPDCASVHRITSYNVCYTKLLRP